MPTGARPSRVAEECREILAEEIQRLKDPRLGFVTVIGVDISPDLRQARVLYTSLGDERAKAGTRAALRSATARLRHELGRQVRLKVVPELRFEEDATPESAERIDRILDELHKTQDTSGGASP